MLQLPAIKQYEDWATVYPDSDSDSIFYAIPNLPRLRWFADGTPAFTFLKFREAAQSGGADPGQNASGGGYVQFDCELSLTKQQNDTIVSDMQSAVDKIYRARNQPTVPVQIAPPTWHDSDKVSVMLITFPEKPDGDGFINHIGTAGKPSMLGSNVATFAAELSQRGAALLWQAFQMAVMPVSVAYRLEVMAQIPTVTMHVWLHAGQVHQFHEQIDKDIDSSVWGDTDQQYTDTMSEIFSKYAVGGVDVTGFDPGSGGDDDYAKMKKDMEQQGWALLEQTLQDDMKDKFAPTAAGDKGAEGGYNHTVRDYLEEFTQDIDIYFKDKDTIAWPMNPQGSMEGILTQPGPNGKVPNKADLFKEISLDDDFFKLLQLRIHCNCDFVVDPIDSVLVHVEYGPTVNDFRFTAAAPDQTFRAYIDKSLGKNWTYSYTVNYKGTDRTLKSAPALKGNGDALIINVADMGFLKLQVTAGQFNWDVIDSAQVRIKYSDDANGVPDQEDVLLLTSKSPGQLYSRMIYAPFTQPYQYAVDLFFKDEQRTTIDYKPSRSTSLTVTDVFSDRLAITVIPSGTFNQITRIVVDLDYEDPAHQYTQQLTVQFTTESDKQVWLVPIWPGGPTSFRYRSLLAYRDGHTIQNDWQTQTGTATLVVGEVFAKTLSVVCMADLIDWTKVRLIKVALHYADPANQIDESDDMVFTSAKPNAPPWAVPIKDPAKLSFDYTITFYNADSTQQTVPLTTTSDPTIVLQVPPAAAGAAR
jgi:hypothetical protein